MDVKKVNMIKDLVLYLLRCDLCHAVTYSKH